MGRPAAPRRYHWVLERTPSPAAALRALAATQGGQFAVRQALEVGMSRGAVLALARRGESSLRARGVWRFVASGGEPDAAVTGALQCLPDGVVSHCSAGHRHGIRRVARPPLPEVTVAHGRHIRPSGVVVRQSRELQRIDVVTVGGVRCTTLVRTIIDLADPRDAWETLGVLDDGIAAGAVQRKVHLRGGGLERG